MAPNTLPPLDKLDPVRAWQPWQPDAELIRPLAAELRESRYSVGHVVGIILRSRRFYAEGNRQRIKSPVDFSPEFGYDYSVNSLSGIACGKPLSRILATVQAGGMPSPAARRLPLLA